MKKIRWCVVLLTLLLAGISMIPMVNAADTSLANVIQANENMKISVPDNNHNLFDEFGLQKPTVNEKAAPFRNYEASKDVSDKILKQAKLSDNASSVIGLYDFGNAQMLLLNHGDHVLEAFYDGKTVKTYLLTPTLLGDKTVTETPKKIAGPEGDSGDYTITTSVRTQLYSIQLTYPEDNTVVPNVIRPLSTYTVTRTRTDGYRNGAGTTIAQLVTTGVFYVNYGSSITSISNGSSWWLNPTVPGYSKCFYTYQESGIGTTSGQLYNHFKFGTLYLRFQMDIWVSVDVYLNGSDGGSTNQWVAVSPFPDGCTN